MKVQRICLKGIISVLVSFPLICNSLVFAERWTVESLQKEIDARGYKWKAGKTALSGLSLEELQTMSGQKFPHSVRMMSAEERITLPDDFPTFLDWRNYKGGNWISPVKNQLPCGSCYAFGPVGVMESLIKLYYNDPDLPVDLSEQYLVSCSPFRCKGAPMPYDAMYYFFYSGVPDEECFPYATVQFSGFVPPCTNACSDFASRIHKPSSYSYIGGEGLSISLGDQFGFLPYPENIKAVLINKPVVCVMLVGMDYSFYTSGIYEPTGLALFGHFVEIIGFDDAQQCWICKNSFGTDWGETADFKPYTPGAGDGGFFRVSYVTSLEDTKTFFGAYAADMNYDGGPPVLPSTSTTTTTISCPSEELYGEGSEELELLRHFRDTVLKQNAEGKDLIKLYYQWSPFVLKIMQEDEEFREEVKAMVDEIMGMVDVE